jgi:molybdopterin-guanine dinucleotide biosynthesis protein B
VSGGGEGGLREPTSPAPAAAAAASIPMVAIVGSSGSGKTTLIERLLPWLAARGVRVAVLKHDAHRFQMDHPGKDTDRFFRAGARQVAIAGAQEIALREHPEPPALGGAAEESPRALAARLFHHVDLILTEGYRSGDLPKVEVFRRGVGGPLPPCVGDPLLRLLLTDRPGPHAVAALPLDDLAGFGDWLLREFLGRRPNVGERA